MESERERKRKRKTEPVNEQSRNEKRRSECG